MARELYTDGRGRLRQTDAHWARFWVLLALVGAALVAWVYLDPTPSGGGQPARTIVVRQGDGWTETTEQLRSADIVRRPLTFKALVLLSGERTSLMPGRYQLKPGTSSRDLIAALTDPSSASTVVIPEGWRHEQVGELLVKKGMATEAEWRAAVAAPPDVPALRGKPEQVGLTGYLYPGTYRFTEQDAAQQMVREALAALQEQLTVDILSGLKDQGLSVHEGLTLASIVEREAQAPQERAIIASVYLNRLRADMRLQADPTTQYAVGESGDWWTSQLTRSDLRNPSPYNTYVHEGLPPAPICSPGAPSIQAVAFPDQTSYLYFVAKGDGTHAFAETYEEHERNVDRYLRR